MEVAFFTQTTGSAACLRIYSVSSDKYILLDLICKERGGWQVVGSGGASWGARTDLGLDKARPMLETEFSIVYTLTVTN